MWSQLLAGAGALGVVVLALGLRFTTVGAREHHLKLLKIAHEAHASEKIRSRIEREFLRTYPDGPWGAMLDYFEKMVSAGTWLSFAAVPVLVVAYVAHDTQYETYADRLYYCLLGFGMGYMLLGVGGMYVVWRLKRRSEKRAPNPPAPAPEPEPPAS